MSKTPLPGFEILTFRMTQSLRELACLATILSSFVQRFNESQPVFEEGGRLICKNCGASAEPKHRNRFLRRHPAMCDAAKRDQAARVIVTKQLAAGTRSVDEEERYKRDGE